MEGLQRLFHKFSSDPKAVNFYLENTTFGLFYFQRGDLQKVFADKKLLHLLKLGSAHMSLDLNEYLDTASAKQIHKLAELPGEEVNAAHDFPLRWIINGSSQKSRCRVLWLESDDVLLVGLYDILPSTSNTGMLEAKRQEDELRLFESVIKNTKDAVLITKADESNELPGWEILFANNAFCEMTGYSREEIVGQTPKMFQGEKTDRAILDKVRKSLELWEPCEYDLINYKKNGEEFWVNMSITPLTDENGWYTHWIAIERDITEAKKSEHLLARSERQHRQLVDNSNDIIYSITAEGIFTFASPAWIKLLGHTTEEVVGTSFTDYVYPDDIPVCAAFLQKVVETGERQEGVEYRVKHKEGHLVWHTSSATPINDESGKIIGYDGLARDITETKEAKELLAASEKQYRQLVDNSNDIIYSITAEGIFTFASPAWIKLLGHSPEEVIGTSFTDYVYPDDIPACAAFLQKVVESGERQGGVEYRVKHKEGHLVWHTSSATPINDDSGKIIGYDGLARDITQSKEMQHQLVEAKDQAEESEQRLQLAVDSGQLGIWDWNLKTRIFTLDDQAYALIAGKKRTKENTVDIWFENLHPEDKERVVKEVEDSLRSKTEYNTIYRFIHPNGKQLHLHAHGIIIRNEEDKAVRMIGIAQDVTDEKIEQIELLTAAKSEVEESEKRLKLASKAAKS